MEELQHHKQRHCASVCCGVSVGQVGSSAGSGHRPHAGGCKGGKCLYGAGTPCGSQEGTLGAFMWDSQFVCRAGAHIPFPGSLEGGGVNGDKGKGRR